jgi:pimeloyl-ACP methyl ester carboxylesterase
VRRRTGVLGGVVGATAAAVAAGIAIEKYAIGRARRVPDLHVGEPFGQLPSDRTTTVIAEDGVPLHVEEVGPSDAPLTAVFVHGYTLNLGSFHFQRAALQSAFGDNLRMVFYDQRSHGRSGRSAPSRASLAQLAIDLAQVIEELVPVGPVVLVGHSMGGMAIMELAATDPALFAPIALSVVPSSRRLRNRGAHRAVASRGRVVAVALLSTSPGDLAGVTLGLPSLVGRVRSAVTPALLRTARRTPALVERGRRIGGDVAWLITRRLSFGGKDVSPAVTEYLHAMIAATPVDVIADFYGALLAHDRRDALGALSSCDVVVVCGDHDLMTPLAHSRLIVEALPNAALYIVPGAGHVAMMEQPDVVNGVLEQFIGDALEAVSGRRRA